MKHRPSPLQTHRMLHCDAGHGQTARLSRRARRLILRRNIREVDVRLLLGLAILFSVCAAAFADENPKRGGILTFMIPADSPPSFDGHRENTFATIHAVAPFYSVLIRANPDNPADTDRKS